MRGEAKIWLDFAYEDLRMAELALKEKIYNQVCFHAEQCVEKVLKSFIINSGRIHPPSHKLADLTNYLGESIFDDLKKDIISLDRFYIPTRYPDALPGSLPEGLPGESEAEEALKTAKAVYGRAQKEFEKL